MPVSNNHDFLNVSDKLPSVSPMIVSPSPGREVQGRIRGNSSVNNSRKICSSLSFRAVWVLHAVIHSLCTHTTALRNASIKAKYCFAENLDSKLEMEAACFVLTMNNPPTYTFLSYLFEQLQLLDVWEALLSD